MLTGFGAAKQHYTLRFCLAHTYPFPLQACRSSKMSLKMSLHACCCGVSTYQIHALLDCLPLDYFADLEQEAVQGK